MNHSTRLLALIDGYYRDGDTYVATAFTWTLVQMIEEGGQLPPWGSYAAGTTFFCLTTDLTYGTMDRWEIPRVFHPNFKAGDENLKVDP